MVITNIGQVAIKTPSRTFILTPSLASISKLKNPIETYTILNTLEQATSELLQSAYDVLLACSDSDEIKKYFGRQLIGKPVVRGNKITKKYTDVFIDEIHAVCIARSLIHHGMVGDVKTDRPSKESDYSSEFDPLDWVSAIIAHLNMSERDAWQMTMTSILAALKVKFPPSEKEIAAQKAIEEKAAFDEWYKSIYGEKS